MENKKVYVVTTIWRTDEDFGGYSKVFDTKEKAKLYLAEETKSNIIDYNITEDDSRLEKSEDSVEFCTGNWDCFEIWIREMEVE